MALLQVEAIARSGHTVASTPYLIRVHPAKLMGAVRLLLEHALLVREHIMRA